MQKSARIAEISTKVSGGGVTFYVHPVQQKVNGTKYKLHDVILKCISNTQYKIHLSI